MSLHIVIPARAGSQSVQRRPLLDSRLRGNDGNDRADIVIPAKAGIQCFRRSGGNDDRSEAVR